MLLWGLSGFTEREESRRQRASLSFSLEMIGFGLFSAFGGFIF